MQRAAASPKSATVPEGACRDARAATTDGATGATIARPSLARLAIACLASLLCYLVLFAAVLDRPLALGFLRHELDARLAHAARLRSPKLLILAGSNGPYSHRCEVIEPMLHMPCVNGGVAVGIGLDYLFARWQPLLQAGDTVYLPMEEAQYIRSRGATMLGPDAAIMLRHDRATLTQLPTPRWAGALFANDLRGAVMSLIEMTLVAGGFHDPRATTEGETNAWGDHVGHTALLGLASQKVLAAALPRHVTAAAVQGGFGTREILRFIAWARRHGVRVIGGLPTEFADAPMPDATLAAIRQVYLGHGAGFLELANRSRYPRSAFFDSPDHLNEQWQIRHSRLLAGALTRLVALRQAAVASPACQQPRQSARSVPAPPGAPP